VGVNVRSANTSQFIVGKQDFRAFAVTNWPTQRGFIPTYSYFPSDEWQVRYAYGHQEGGGLQVCARQGGTVFFHTAWQPSYYNYPTYYYYGGAVNVTGGYDYGSYLGQVHCFNSDIGGPVQKCTNLSGDTGAYNARSGQLVFPSNDGSKVAYIYNTYTTSYGYMEYENLHVANDTRLTPSGGLMSAPSSLNNFTLSSSRRICTSVAFSPSGDKIYFAAGQSNENNKTFYEQNLVPDPGTGQLPALKTIATTRWFEVLHCGR
jgi:hypothetical protein